MKLQRHTITPRCPKLAAVAWNFSATGLISSRSARSLPTFAQPVASCAHSATIHGEQDPSFYISWFYYGCNRGADLFALVMSS